MKHRDTTDSKNTQQAIYIGKTLNLLTSFEDEGKTFWSWWGQSEHEGGDEEWSSYFTQWLWTTVGIDQAKKEMMMRGYYYTIGYDSNFNATFEQEWCGIIGKAEDEDSEENAIIKAIYNALKMEKIDESKVM